MSADEYWFGDPHLIFRYESVYQHKQKLKEQDFWLMGTYIVRAIESARFNVNGFIEKNNWLVPYPNCPHTDLFNNERKPSREQIELYEKARAQLSSLGLLRD